MEAVRLQSWYATQQGRMVAETLGQAVERWLSNGRVVHCCGAGYIQPYLTPLCAWSDSVLGVAPAEMGVASWSQGQGNRIALVRTDALPFPDESFDRLFISHLLEGVHDPHSTLREVWRVLKPGGRVLIMVPNRGGLWARRDSTPFGWGRPFSPKQLQELLHDSLFIPQQSTYALFTPPFCNPWLLRAAQAWEKAGQRWFAPLGGIILCDAEKVVYATALFDRKMSYLPRRSLVSPMVNQRDSLSLRSREAKPVEKT